MKTDKSIRLVVPELGEEELDEVRKVFKSGYLTCGPMLAEFEKTVANFVGTKYALATTSATTALHLSLAALGIGSGDEVLVPDFTFPATANVVIQQGARPVFVDISLDTFTMDINDLEKKITKKSKAVIPVHAFGLSADMNPILEIAKKNNLYVVEDAACALGTTYYGKPCGSLGTMGCFSFHPRKAITTGEGGMITTDSKKLAEKIIILRNHGGIRKKGRFTFVSSGYNYRMSDIQAAVGVVQMKKIKKIIDVRRKLAKIMSAKFNNIEGISIPKEPVWEGHVFQSYVVLLHKRINRDAVIQKMKGKGIETTIGTYALSAQPFFRKFLTWDEISGLKNSNIAYRQSLTLPLYPKMSISDVEYIIENLTKAI